ncbi:hypothetical protein [Bacteroides cellulosilyticus]|uniref:hypothetical protein n=1 Tax=Bacteroides cellulosilyticus TaxID=246787 RepID=UPI001864861E|nr:hypothetical protein [Bacteroides cellulosilyticus]
MNETTMKDERTLQLCSTLHLLRRTAQENIVLGTRSDEPSVFSRLYSEKTILE